jgi:trans-aconitate 2-methyltransferase
VIREWNARSYDRIGSPMTERGFLAVERLALRGDETVLDAGCGTGRVTAGLLERLPRGRAVALDASQQMLDASQQMLDAARERLGDDPRVTYVCADIECDLGLAETVDAIISTSTLHWIRDHDALWPRLAAALRPGGQLVVDCGGEGNTAAIMSALDELGVRDSPWTFAGVDETLSRLRAAGFGEAQARLRPRPATIPADELEEFLRTVILRLYVDAWPAAEGDALVRGVMERLPGGVIDYVRLEVEAVLDR